ncbi:SDR family NAD(P)-dependent oxidoreductase [Paraburkholderia unamae]|uniref:NAD(P)-dependent dehydrogenase (Short-subunit alcohol dehydrogenase family) n=1 Tax=Paraburkholderia unamae TaxID=219649 RepID=A0ABX5KFD3_9BURK|nr:SDR family oxidoreductase [Paraburkholderia unamae]PVX71602.1 NAD(P)-dependent dehydrogenase (short-subunit alcohol dehydrogenase family) [Paraburkholderia unamae]CAG9274702.1 Levodione reductase [Paraburkholderia unamae]
MARLGGKTVLITGAARGIGAAAARLFVQEGAQVMLVDVLEDPLRSLAQELGTCAAFVSADISDEASCANAVNATVERFGRIDAALLNAGIAGDLKPLVDYSAETFDKVVAVNVRGTWLGLKHVMRAMQPSGGSIVVTASTSSVRATPNMVAYVASKHAVVGLMRAAAMEGAAHGIRVNSVNPATVDTPMVRDLEAGAHSTANKVQTKARLIPLQRQGTVEEVAQLMLFLASDESSFCTGAVYMVDGGVTAGRAA